MKIAFVCPIFAYSKEMPFFIGGTESQIYGISSEFYELGHDIYILGNFLDRDEFKNRDEKINFINLKSLYLKDKILGEPFSALLLSKKIKNTLEEINPDIIILTGRFTSYFPSKLNMRTIFVTHNPDAMFFYKNFSIKNNKFNTFYFYYKNFFEEKVMKKCDVVVALNQSIQKYLYKRDINNIKLIPNAVDASKYKNRSNENFILYAGRLNRVKGIDTLIKAFSNVNKAIEGIKLVIIGSGPEEFKLKRLVKKENVESKVQFIPTVDKIELREHLSRCLLFVLPSLFETFGIVLIEAMASGKPVIASNIPGPSDIIEHGFNGFLFEDSNIKELSEYLRILIEDNNLRDELGRNARKTVLDKYTFQKIAIMYEKLFTELNVNEV